MTADFICNFIFNGITVILMSMKLLSIKFLWVSCILPLILEVLKTVKDTLNIDFDGTTKDKRIRLITQNCFKKYNLGQILW